MFVPVGELIEDFGELLETYTYMIIFLIAGDLNIHVKTDECASRKFHRDIRLETACTWTNTYHTIDVVVSPNKEAYINVEFYLRVAVKDNKSKTFTYRAWKNIDSDVFAQEIKDALENSPVTQDIGEKVSVYNWILSKTYNKHAPLKSKVINDRPSTPRFDGEYKSLRKKRWRAEKEYSKSKNWNDKKEYIWLRKETTELSKEKKIYPNIQQDQGGVF